MAVLRSQAAWRPANDNRRRQLHRFGWRRALRLGEVGLDVRDAVVMVTGSNRGLGRAFVDAFLQAGAAKVYATMRRPDPALFGDPRVQAVPLDVTDDGSVARLAAEAGDTQILVNNAAALTKLAALGAPDIEGARMEMEANYFGVLRMCRAFAPILAANGGGAIVNILSIGALANVPSSGSYCASKAACWSLTQAVRAELRGQGTLVMAVFAGAIATEMARAGNTTPRCPPDVMAANIVEALRRDETNVFPDTSSAATGELYKKDPWALEAQLGRNR